MTSTNEEDPWSETTYQESKPDLSDEARQKLGHELYEIYGKPLEAKHWGKLLAVSPDGRILLVEEQRRHGWSFFSRFRGTGARILSV